MTILTALWFAIWLGVAFKIGYIVGGIMIMRFVAKKIKEDDGK